jgi:uncharacterized protein (TIGR02444 family)
VPALCLCLQDQNGVDVNVLLYLIWAGHCGRKLDGAHIKTIRDLIEDWRLHVVVPLRGVRRWLKEPTAVFHDRADQLRQTIKAAELESERLQQEVLFAHADVHSLGEPAPVAEAMNANIRGYELLLKSSFDAASLNVLLTEYDNVRGNVS